MLRKVLKYIFNGISWGCTISCLVSIVGVWKFGNEWFTYSPRSYVQQIIAAMIVGIGWVLPSMIYTNEKISRGLQTIIQMTIGFIVYFPCAFYMGWISTNRGIISILVEILVVFALSFLAWFLFSLYYRKEAKIINEKITKMSNK